MNPETANLGSIDPLAYLGGKIRRQRKPKLGQGSPRMPERQNNISHFLCCRILCLLQHGRSLGHKSASADHSWFMKTSEGGTKLTPPRRRRMSAFKGEAVISLNRSLVSE